MADELLVLPIHSRGHRALMCRTRERERLRDRRGRLDNAIFENSACFAGAGLLLFGAKFLVLAPASNKQGSIRRNISEN